MKRSTRLGFYHFWMWLVLSLHLVAWKLCCRCQNCDTTYQHGQRKKKNHKYLIFSNIFSALEYFTEHSLMWDVWDEGVVWGLIYFYFVHICPQDTHLGQIKRNSVISSTSRDAGLAVLVPIKVISYTGSCLSSLLSDKSIIITNY